VVIRSVVHEKASSRQGWKTMRGDEVSLVVVVTNLTWETIVTSVISPSIGVITKLSTIAKFCKYERFHEGTILFRWPWRCTTQEGVIWIISSGNVLVFCMINDWEVIYLCLFAFSFLGYTLILFFSMF
jgi:hypothetical protein